jgi:hypothetical protein
MQPGFAGYFLIRTEGYGPTLLHFYPPLVEDFDELMPLGESGQLDAFAPALGVALDAERGNAIVVGRDCTGGPPAGLTFRLEGDDPGASLFYSVRGAPGPSASSTDVNGSAFAFNLQPTFVTIRGARDKDGEIARASALVRPGYLTQLNLRPDRY